MKPSPARVLSSVTSLDHKSEVKTECPKITCDKANQAPKVSAKSVGKKAKDLFAVIDVETNYDGDVMSIGLVVADSNFGVKEKVYFVISPAYKIIGMYTSQLFFFQPHICTRDEAITQICSLLKSYKISKIFSYSSFDKRQLLELKEFQWLDIMQKAAYRQYNCKIPQDAEFCSTGRLKRNFGVEPILRMLLDDDTYSEKHNALEDALDELKIMELLGISFDEY